MGQTSYPPNAYPLPGYRFIVFLNELIMGFQKVSGMSREVETEVYREGGLNTSVHIFPKYSSGEHVLRLEKGTYEGVGHPFYMIGEKLTGVLNLIVTDNRGQPLKTYSFSGMIVKKWEIGELSAEQNGILIDRFEISYEDFQVMN